MERSKLDLISDLWGDLQYQFPRWPSTFSGCRVEGKHPGKEVVWARGVSVCKHCTTEKLAALIGEDEAKGVLKQMEDLNTTWGKLYEKYSGQY